ncbi:xanthine dehydrogenase family protein molybdopterin-binding subunit [Ktedonospora formicarum]|uniref:Xanthine dehydrogenase n=1 Tax=Ktedonospora formicarum TaxID=2778364 RepID=A0A8J3MTW5_9CHLR|nr:xanthine dehydrogenase family protein molybdopterin-binding subunit [Ktedonospora formicarum]GHO46346.1 xanthine dehydrogenase [Ktedonospora formicarum]
MVVQTTRKTLIGAPVSRIDGPKKVTGSAPYAYEHEVKGVVYGFPVQSTIAKGRVTSIDTSKASALRGVLGIITHENAPHLVKPPQPELAVLQSDKVAYRGQFVAMVIAETQELAREAAEAIVIQYEESEHDVVLSADSENLYKPDRVNPDFATDTATGDVEAALASATFRVDQTYTTPAYHNNPLEPHATIAIWEDGGITLYDSCQGAHSVQDAIAQTFGLDLERVHVISPYVGGGFGSKGQIHPNVILTVMGAQVVKRPVKYALTRQQMFALAGYRTPTLQRIRLGADKDGHLTAIAHNAISQTSTLHEFAEQTAVATRSMYAAPNRLTSHRLAKLDVPTPSWMRAPGECPGMFALESAMDELAYACGLDPIELRVRNEPKKDPETGNPFSSRGLVTCLREGAKRFGWQPREQTPRKRMKDRWLVGTGVAAATYPSNLIPANALIRAEQNGYYTVLIDATDIGTGAWTILTQIAADALDAPLERVHLEIGDSRLPRAYVAGGSTGTASWGTAIVEAARKLRARLSEEHNVIPVEGLEATSTTKENPQAKRFAMHAYGAHFAEVHVNQDTCELRVPRLLGVFAAGRIMNAKTARSQFMGGMTMGLSMALHEESILDPRFGDYVNHDFAEYHIATNADVREIDISWIDEEDPHVNPLGAKGIGEIGIVGTAAAIANAVYHATGIRVRDLPITLDKLLA